MISQSVGILPIIGITHICWWVFAYFLFAERFQAEILRDTRLFLRSRCAHSGCETQAYQRIANILSSELAFFSYCLTVPSAVVLRIFWWSFNVYCIRIAPPHTARHDRKA